MYKFMVAGRAGKRRAESASKYIESGGVIGSKKFRVTKELLNESYSLSEKQYLCVKSVLEGSSVFFTGSAGTGKSYVLSILMKIFKDLDINDLVALTASTGVAASNIGGLTVHSWAGIQTGEGNFENIVARVMGNPSAVKRWRDTNILVIDEISMISANTFDLLSLIGKRARDDPRPFGGLQVVVCGDFFQLPPVGLSKAVHKNLVFKSEFECLANSSKLYSFKAYSWNQLFHAEGRVIILDQIFRQQEQDFVRMLNEIRRGQCSHETVRILEQRVKDTELMKVRERRAELEAAKPSSSSSEPVSTSNSEAQNTTTAVKPKPTKLYGTNKEVDNENAIQLQLLVERDVDETKHEYQSIDFESTRSQGTLQNMKAPRILTLYANAQVMLLKNLDPERGLVNGTKGVVLSFSKNYIYDKENDNEVVKDPTTGMIVTEYPIVRFMTNIGGVMGELDYEVKEEKFEISTNGHVEAWRSQLPLMLAWAITVHKSQGMTIPHLEVSCKGFFDHGHVYVALSRATNLQNLHLTYFRKDLVHACPDVVDYYRQFGYAGEVEIGGGRGHSNSNQNSSSSNSSSSSSGGGGTDSAQVDGIVSVTAEHLRNIFNKIAVTAPNVTSTSSKITSSDWQSIERDKGKIQPKIDSLNYSKTGGGEGGVGSSESSTGFVDNLKNFEYKDPSLSQSANKSTAFGSKSSLISPMYSPSPYNNSSSNNSSSNSSSGVKSGGGGAPQGYKPQNIVIGGSDSPDIPINNNNNSLNISNNSNNSNNSSSGSIWGFGMTPSPDPSPPTSASKQYGDRISKYNSKSNSSSSSSSSSSDCKRELTETEAFRNFFRDEIVVITGEFRSFYRSRLEELVIKCHKGTKGAKLPGVTGKTTMLIAGHILEFNDPRPVESGQKFQSAKAKAVRILYEDDILPLFDFGPSSSSSSSLSRVEPTIVLHAPSSTNYNNNNYNTSSYSSNNSSNNYNNYHPNQNVNSNSNSNSSSSSGSEVNKYAERYLRENHNISSVAVTTSSDNFGGAYTTFTTASAFNYSNNNNNNNNNNSNNNSSTSRSGSGSDDMNNMQVSIPAPAPIEPRKEISEETKQKIEQNRLAALKKKEELLTKKREAEAAAARQMSELGF